MGDTEKAKKSDELPENGGQNRLLCLSFHLFK